MHKLKLKYRELNSQYSETLKQPVFKTNKRSYSHLAPEAITIKTTSEGKQLTSSYRPGPTIAENAANSIAGLGEKEFASSNVSPHNEYLGETVKEVIPDDEKNRQSKLTDKNQTFQSVQHQF